jgi:hypothetical protein
MDLAGLALLQSPAGLAALADAGRMDPDDSTFLGCYNRLSKQHPPGLARAALQTAVLRRRARAKFSRADAMFFTREALEQATSERVALHRAQRFVGLGRVADLCCGIGGDAAALAGRGPVLAVDRDPLRLAMAGLNLAAHGLGDRAELVAGDVLAVDLPRVGGVFADPDRRVGGRRQLGVNACAPPLEALRSRVPANTPLAVKLAPGVSWAELARYGGEAEFVSLGGELKECVLWLGPWGGPARRATVLPSGLTLAAHAPAAVQPSRAPGAYLYDPDPAVVRAGLVSDLAVLLGARPLDADIAYLTADAAVATPLARCFAVEAALPFHLRRLQECLRQRNVGRVSVSRRGSPVEPDALLRKLKLAGDETRGVVLTRVAGRPYALLTRPV